MLKNKDKFHYSRNYKIGLIFSLFIVIMFFLFLPEMKKTISKTIIYSEPKITIVDIPQTKSSGHPVKPPPKLTISNITNPIVVEEHVDSVEIAQEDILEQQKGNEENNLSGSSEGTDVYEFSSLPFIPRQILEVVPKEIDGAKGQIYLSLRIAKDGSVKEHKILSDNTNKSECLKNVLTAVYKSRWQPITIDGERVEYWVEKVYGFN